MSARKHLVVLVLVVCMVIPAPLVAQAPQTNTDQRVEVGDVLSITVPQRPELNRDLTVAPNGTVNYPLVGEIFVRGLTLDEAERQILQVLRDVYPSISRIEVKSIKAGAFTIYVAGAVSRPGKYSFNEAPNLWDAIMEAGGPGGVAELTSVRVVGDSRKGGRSEVVDVQQALDSGTVERLPKLQDGDSVVIPERVLQGLGRTGVSHGVHVYGSVVTPGTYRVPPNGRVVEAILLSGGSLPEAKMAKVSIVRPVGGGQNQTIHVDIRKFLDSGDPLSNPEVKAGDTIYVPRQNAFLWALKNDAGVIVGLIGSVITLGIVLSNNE